MGQRLTTIIWGKVLVITEKLGAENHILRSVARKPGGDVRPSDEVSVRSRTEAVTTRVPWGEVITINAARWVMGIEGGVTIRLGCEGSVYRRWGSI